jgi:ABC-2 type transport system ATP-binding protein
MRSVLKVENVSIRYKYGDFRDIGLKEWTMRKLTHRFRVENFMAVKDVSFELFEGDLLGIIGSNGAGKSTLLKAVTGVMVPTSGAITRNGRISALLELASGFDGDLTVKENAYLRGAMLGYTRKFMNEAYDQIIEFAELREFEERPFKQLSSGMQSRLAFSIASLVQPEILILDEVLSVGDGAFQEKSSKKMMEIIKSGAVTILVSHSIDQIEHLCNKVLWLHHGSSVALGDTHEICKLYKSFLAGNKEALSIAAERFKPQTNDQAEGNTDG